MRRTFQFGIRISTTCSFFVSTRALSRLHLCNLCPPATRGPRAITLPQRAFVAIYGPLPSDSVAEETQCPTK
jgi:hypothetical protein